MGDFAIRLYIEKKGLQVGKKGVGRFRYRSSLTIMEISELINNWFYQL